MDTKDDAHHVAVAKPNSLGDFTTSFVVGPTNLGSHNIVGKQGANDVVSPPFTLTSTQQVDDRSWDAWQVIAAEVGNIEGKLDNPATGLAEIKTEVSDIQTKVNDPATGLAEIMTEVSIIQTAVNDIETDMANVPAVYSGSDSRNWTSGSGETVPYDYGTVVKHVSLTIRTHDISSGNSNVHININFASAGTVELDTIEHSGIHTFEFDTKYWELKQDRVSGDNFSVQWNWTTIAPAA
jgi:hypothetical protein